MMVKEKFEFHKLELPTNVVELSGFITDETPLNQTKQEKKIKKSRKYLLWLLIIFILIAIILTIASLFPKKSVQKKSKNALNTLQKVVKKPKSEKIKPQYRNYFDSIIFLNDIQGTKKVISKGFDDYLKKERIIIKSESNYFSCYCDDLIQAYQVGDLIP